MKKTKSPTQKEKREKKARSGNVNGYLKRD